MLQNKPNRNIKFFGIKIQKISSNVSPFAGISFVNNEFDKAGIGQLIDSELGTRVKTVGFSYSDIIKNLGNVLYSGGDCAEDIQTHLGKHLKSIPGNHVPSADTILRGIKELSTQNTSFTSNQGKTYDFNINTKLNLLNIKSLLLTRQLKKDTYYDFDYDNQIIATEKYDTKHTYKHTKGYFPGVATIGNKIVYIENRDGNANVKLEVASISFTQFFEEENYRLVIMREKSDDNQIDMFTGDTFIYRSILTNDLQSTEKEVIEYYNQRGSSEKLFDMMNNDFGWKHLPCSFMNENTVYLIIMAMAKNFYNYFVEKVSNVFENINPTTRLKRFIFRFISVAGKWIYTGRQWVLKLFTDKPYEALVV